MAATTNIFSNGMKWALGNRDSRDEIPPWLARTERASRNMAENLPLFAIVVLVAHASGSADEMSSQGATLFFGGRVAHALIYIGGIPGLRTLVWCVSIAGLGMVAASILT